MSEARIVELAVKAGHPLPQVILDAPVLLPTMQIYWNCYFDLRRGKTMDQALQWWEVQYWCEAHQLDVELTTAVHAYTLELDHIWIGLQPKTKEPPDGNNRRDKRG